MSKEIYISSTPHETRLAIVENDALTEIYYERENEYTLAGSIYNGKVTRVLPGMQSSFVDIGLERDAFLYITDFMEEAGDSADFETTGNGDSRSKHDRRGRDSSSASAPEDSTPAANEDNRSDRNGRDRGGRGRRDRNRGSRSDRPEAQPSGETGSEDFERQPDFAAASESDISTRPESSDSGEPTPGIEGSRRWRGRRGRRRGRGPREDSSQSATAAPQTEEGFIPRNQEDDDSGSVIDADLDAVSGSVSTDVASSESAYEQPRESNITSPSDPNRRDRGRGGRNRGDRDRGNRGDGHGDRSRDDRGSRVPRGFAPKTALYGVEETPAYAHATDASVIEPIVLSGESLSKYRKPGEESPAVAKSANLSVAEPIALPTRPGYTISGDWDGGAILPGETLSRHRSRPSSSEPRRNEPQADHLDDARPASSLILPEPPAPVEYEPVEASASYRVDTIAQSEFRQNAPVLEPEEVEVEETSPVHTITLSPQEPVAPLHAAAEETGEEVWDWQKAPTPQSTSAPETIPAHDVTTLQATGEMTSNAPSIEPSAPPVPQEVREPAAPIHHETAILSSSADESASLSQHLSSATLEEEELSEDDQVLALQASSIEELDDLDEEETLENAADLGTMIREMSIDQITRPSEADSDLDADEEDDDYDHYEEEDSIEDNLSGDLEESEYSESSEEDSDAEVAFASPSDADVFNRDSFSPTLEHSSSTGVDYIAAPASPLRDVERRRRDRRDGRRIGRRDRSRGTGSTRERERTGSRNRQYTQSTNLPAISDLLKPGQEVLVQIAKEPIAKKGARITSHIALPGRFLVFMPTVNHTGVSRKIESDTERRRLKDILLSEKGDASGGFIVRTAAAGATEEELRSDLRFLLNLWADIKSRSESSKSPALIYHDLNLVERILRDQVTDTFSAIWVDTETDYERILRFLQRFQPSLIRRVKLYTKETPLFEQFGITEEINKALRSKVWLKSGGSIVINQTEALVAIDINTGKFVGKTARLEDTIVKTNLDAIPEIVRQIRLRDLGGIIIIDFIDMDERKNRNRVMAALEEELKTDRAPSKVLQFNDFGLVAITRKRVKQSLERTLSTTCNICTGTGMVKSPITVCNDIYIEMRKMHRHLDRGDVMLRVHPDVVKALKSSTSRWLQEMEEMVGKTILVKSDPTLHPEQFDIH